MGNRKNRIERMKKGAITMSQIHELCDVLSKYNKVNAVADKLTEFSLCAFGEGSLEITLTPEDLRVIITLVYDELDKVTEEMDKVKDKFKNSFIAELIGCNNKIKDPVLNAIFD